MPRGETARRGHLTSQAPESRPGHPTSSPTLATPPAQPAAASASKRKGVVQSAPSTADDVAPMQGFALVDFRNLQEDLARGATPMIALEEVLDAVVGGFRRWRSVREIDVRLYGGWLDERGNPSQNANAFMPLLPFLRGRRQGTIVRPSLALGLLKFPYLRLRGTVRITRRGRRQKMVDQMIGCDALYLALRPHDDLLVAVFTGDDDLLPPLLIANACGEGEVRWMRGQGRDRPNDARLSSFGVVVDGGAWNA